MRDAAAKFFAVHADAAQFRRFSAIVAGGRFAQSADAVFSFFDAEHAIAVHSRRDAVDAISFIVRRDAFHAW